MRLTDDELRDVLARAEEIQRSSRRGDLMQAELQAVIGAAEEVGLYPSLLDARRVPRLRRTSNTLTTTSGSGISFFWHS
jgi:hypothetical protein